MKRRFLAIITMLALLCASIPAALPAMAAESEYQVDLGNGSAYTCSIGGAFSYDAGQKVGTLTRNGNSPSLTVYLGQKRAWPNENSPWYHVSYDVRIPEGADQAQWTLGNLPFQTPGSDGGWQGFIVTPKYVQDGDGWAIDFGPDNAASYEKRPADLREWTTIDIWLDCTSGESTDVYIGVNGELKGPYTSSYYVQELQSLAFSSNNVTDASQLQVRNVVAATTESGPETPEPPQQTEYRVDLGIGRNYYCAPGNAFAYDAEQQVGTITRSGNNPSLAVFLGQKDIWPNANSPWYHVSYEVRIPEGAAQAQWTLGHLASKHPGSGGAFAAFIVKPIYFWNMDSWAITFGTGGNAPNFETRPADLSEWTTIDIWLDCTTGGNTDLYFGINGELTGPYTSSCQVKELQSLAFSSDVSDSSKLQIRNITAAMTESGPELFDYAVSIKRLSDTVQATAACGLNEGSGSADCRLYLASYSGEGRLLSVEVTDKFTLSYETPEQKLEAAIPPETKSIKAFLWGENLLPLDMAAYEMPASSLRVLAIGNSFSEDAVQWLYQIAADYGIEEIILGNLYASGCSLQQHWEYAENGTASYIYGKNTEGTWQNSSGATMLEGLTDEHWDIITLQQASGSSGLDTTYEPYLTKLVGYINEHKTNQDAKLFWHMTWAYQSGSDNSEFANYDNNQSTMYEAICDTVQTVVSDDRFDGVIPTGTAVQNVRTSYIGDTLTRDGSHLSNYLGRYVAGLMWFKSLTGYEIGGITYVPNASEIDDKALLAVKEAVNAAYTTPFAVTPSSYTD